MSLHFLSYAEAFAALQSRYPDLTEAELRMWVNGKRSLVALTNPLGKTRRSRLRHPSFRFHWSGSGDQSINALLDCWFPSKQVFRFVPSQRYLTYERLVERWQGRTAKDIHAFIAERVNEFRKNPDFGFLDFGAFDPLGRQDLPIEDYVFALDQVEDKERKWLIGPIELPNPQYRPFQMEDVRYFARLPLWTRQEAAYLTNGASFLG